MVADHWRHRRGRLGLSVPTVMGIVNATPDSFSDGGRWLDDNGPQGHRLDLVVETCRRWCAAGLEVVDVGGESTRPGSRPVARAEEIARIVPVIEALRHDPGTQELLISVDTRHAEVAAVAVDAGADIINDVSGLADPDMASIAATTGAGLVIGHMRGTPATMMNDIAFDDVVGEVAHELGLAVARAQQAGVAPEAIVVDPCVGFGKDARQSAVLTGAGADLSSRCGYPVLIGASRKRFIGDATKKGVGERMAGSLAAAVVAMERGARIVRVHDVEPTLDARAVWLAVRDATVAEYADAGDRGLLRALQESLVRAASTGVGALILLESQRPCVDVAVHPGSVIDAPVDAALLGALWAPHPGNVLHDGAVLLRRGPGGVYRIARAGLVCPPSQADLPPGLGTRHRAALGMTEHTDALAIVLSEGRGSLRIAQQGDLSEPRSLAEVTARIEAWLAHSR